jgi:zinc/manganese transport system permease protein
VIYHFLIEPFVRDEAMRRALVAIVALSLGATPIGVFLMLRRMSLMGDVMAHAILPGAAVGFLIAGTSLVAMATGGLVAGLIVALLSGLVARGTEIKEDASLAAFFIISLALGLVIASARGDGDEILEFLFGDVLALDNAKLILIAAIATLSMTMLALIWRPLVLECVDPVFLRSVSGTGGVVHLVFLALVMINLIAAFLALGTLLAVGLMMLPAIAARLWTRDMSVMVAVAAALGIVSGYGGLLLSVHARLAAGPSTIMVAGVLYAASLLFGRTGGVLRGLFARSHLQG